MSYLSYFAMSMLSGSYWRTSGSKARQHVVDNEFESQAYAQVKS